jgi:hypothetical protein
MTKQIIETFGNYRTYKTEAEAHSDKAVTAMRMEMLDCVKETCEYCDVKVVKTEFPIYSKIRPGEYTIGWKVVFTFPGKDTPRE